MGGLWLGACWLYIKRPVQAFPCKSQSTSCQLHAFVRIAQLVERWSNKPLVLGSIPNVNTLFVVVVFFFFFGDTYSIKQSERVWIICRGV